MINTNQTIRPIPTPLTSSPATSQQENDDIYQVAGRLTSIGVSGRPPEFTQTQDLFGRNLFQQLSQAQIYPVNMRHPGSRP